MVEGPAAPYMAIDEPEQGSDLPWGKSCVKGRVWRHEYSHIPVKLSEAFAPTTVV